MLQELKTLFAQQAKQELLQTMRDFHSCRQEKGQSFSSYILKMKGFIDNLDRLGHPVTLGLGVSLILIGLRKEYDGFVQNYNIHGMGRTVNELHAILKPHEQTLPKSSAPALYAIRASKVQKGNKHKKSQSQTLARGQNHGKGKHKKAYAPKPKIPPPPKRENPTNDSIYHECGEASKKLKPRALSLYMGNGQHEAIEAIGAFYLCPPSGLDIVVNNYHYAPSITREVISVSRLYEDGFVNRFVDNTIQVSKNNVVYFSDVLRDGIFEIDLSNSLTNESSIYAVSNKRAKLDLDYALLKMARKPYTHQVERVKDLLGLTHTDVCGPFKNLSRQGASYFVTFTDDFSRYGYVYLLKHKHEVFETFKVFQKEVENQLGKTIQSPHSDRGGEYKSQEFLDHLKDHGIIAHRAPPYTSQQNDVSERRNRDILDMVKKTPYEVWHGKAPKLSYLKVWGYEALVKRDTLIKPDKLEPRSIKYTSLNHEEDDLEIDEPQSDIVPIYSSTRTRHALDRMCLYIDAEEHELGDLGEPANYKAALLDPKSKKWLNAINVEMQSMKNNEVWVLVELPPNGKTVGSKWLFKKKTDIDGNVHVCKSRLVAKDYTQTIGIDYKKTFSPVADIRAIRILIAIAAYYDYEIWQIDVKTAFLNGYLNEEEKLKLSKSQGVSTPAELKRMQNVPYALAVGFIMYAVRCALLDVAFAQNVTSRFQQNTSDIHWTTLKNILKYLGNTKDMFLTGYVFILNGGVVDWKSPKQSIFATSFAEAEYIAAFDASKEAIWVRKFISWPGLVPTIKESTSMYCDNTGAITIANVSRITKVSQSANFVFVIQDDSDWLNLEAKEAYNGVTRPEPNIPLRANLGVLHLTNESSVYAVSNKRAKLNLYFALLWHCRLGHISKKRIKKLQHEGLLNSSDLTAFEKCVSCMSRKMAKKPYTHQVERAKDLLGLIHTDLNAMNVEMQSMKDNEVWVLVKLPLNGKTIGSKWLFKKKTDMDGNVHIYKARLVAKGFSQTPGIDYEETFSLVADIRAIRILIAIAAYYGYEIWQMDVKTAFVNGYLNDEVYMEQPEGFVNP
nr:hypothetical protein [Tanacetum cinerariifolium]